MTETPGPGDITPDKLIGVLTTERLEPGKNFYEQPPFENILENVSGKTSVNVEELRRLLHILTSNTSFKEFKTSQELTQAMRIGFVGARSEVLAEKERANRTAYDEGVKEMGEQLLEYPYWMEYIKLNRSEFYLPDGSPRPEGQRSTFISSITALSYGKWAEDRMARDYRFNLRDLEEVLPQGFETQPNLPSAPKSSQVRKAYRVIKATELTKYHRYR